MCGIAGVRERKGGLVDPTMLQRMVSALSHRGPDGRGVHIEGDIGLGHARLSIIDLAGGKQPMSNPEGTIWISFNGEIFNYVELRSDLIGRGWHFATKSDTEVILRLYEEMGEDCVHELNGQWAFAIWDARQGKLFLSRDRMGIRPLFYAQTAERFLFASEIKALFASGADLDRRIDLRALDQIFTFWVTLPPRTAFEGISQLPPGHSMIVREDRTTIVKYWEPNYEPEDTEDSLANVKIRSEELLNLLQDATRIRLRSDVPVGAYLSGGIDSTFITALIQRVHKGRLKTFSVAFDDAEFDESSFQQSASAFLGTEHQQVRCSYQDIGQVFPQVVWHAEQPILRTAPAPLFRLSSLVHESGFKVVLTGEGADEILGGYDIFKEAKIRRFWASNLDSRRRPLLLKRLYPYMQNLQTQSNVYLKSFFHTSESDRESPFFSHLPRWQLTSMLKMFFSKDVRSQLASRDAYRDLHDALPDEYAGWPHFCQAEYLETAYLMPGYILSSQGDRMAMAHSVEGRYPFLDHRVVKFAERLSPSLKMKVLNQKFLLKHAAEGLIPSEIIRRPKQPYRAPDGKSFFQPQALPYVEELLAPEALVRSGIFDPPAVTALVKKFKAGRAIGVKDNMALVGILSTQLLTESFINRLQSGAQVSWNNSTAHCAVS
ncbi:MAG: asparagine synthase (glutamine-hydrolyzing) [Candidatus Sulfotelmatobacter sp.]